MLELLLQKVGETPPPLDGFDALWVMGGPMDVWEEDIHPWLIDEKALIREAVEGRGMPFLGFCLGHQLLACALGGDCARAAPPEIGVMPVRLTGPGAESIFLDDVPELPKTRAMLMKTCDVRLPARLTRNDLDFIAGAILDAAEQVKGSDRRVA